MKFALPRQKISDELEELLERVIRRQKIEILRTPARRVKEIANVVQAIEKEGIPKRFVCKELPGKIGMGVFLHPEAEPIEGGEVIGPYSGKVTLTAQNAAGDSAYAFSLVADLSLNKEEQRVFDPKARFHPRRLYSADLDAEKMGNFTRYINHSDKPNIDAFLLEIPKNRYGLKPSPAEIIYVAGKKIRPGEQLLVCYEDENKGYWGVLNIKPFKMSPRTFQLDKNLNLKVKK